MRCGLTSGGFRHGVSDITILLKERGKWPSPSLRLGGGFQVLKREKNVDGRKGHPCEI